MALINFHVGGMQRCVTVPTHSTILQGIRQSDIKFETPCNGIGLCGKCKVIARGNLEPPSEEEKKFIDINRDERLACMAKIIGNVDVEFIRKHKELQTINSGDSVNVKVDSNIKLIQNRYDGEEKYAVIYKDEIIDVLNKKDIILAVAVDIGTTGISAYLLNLENGEILNKLSSLNPQTEFGSDVLSRITYCMNNKQGVKNLQKLIVDEINRLTLEMLCNKYAQNQVYSFVVAGNTTMLHLLRGIDPCSMAKAPYTPVFLNTVVMNASEIGFSGNNHGIVTLLPGSSSYVGSDIVAGIVSSGFNNKKHNSIFIDIGTNGEIAVISHGKMLCTSTAAGPALEGMNICCGCRAEMGAIEAFNISDDYNITFSTIGDKEPVGICGSGLIDMAGEMVKRNIILKSGKFNYELDERICKKLRDKKFYITDKVYLSQKDIRQIQLAKGAIAAGIKMLLEEINLTIADVEEVIIAGAFGYHINPKSILNIGLIPRGFSGTITFAGNTSIEGARLATINKFSLDEMEDIKEKMKTLELSTSDKFQDYFINELNF